MEVRIIDETQRKKLHKPFGKVMQTEEVVRRLKKYNCKVVCVGDICSFTLIKEGIIPTIAIVDGRSLRKSISKNITKKIIQNYNKGYHVKNAPGTISNSALIAIEAALSENNRCYISVDGEEDLLALAAIIKSKYGNVVIYGQPGEGMVYIKVNKKTKEKARRIFRKMKVVEIKNA